MQIFNEVSQYHGSLLKPLKWKNNKLRRPQKCFSYLYILFEFSRVWGCYLSVCGIKQTHSLC